jgi:hypothetical protein
LRLKWFFATQVYLVASDGLNRVASCAATVTIADVAPPTSDCRDTVLSVLPNQPCPTMDQVSVLFDLLSRGRHMLPRGLAVLTRLSLGVSKHSQQFEILQPFTLKYAIGIFSVCCLSRILPRSLTLNCCFPQAFVSATDNCGVVSPLQGNTPLQSLCSSFGTQLLNFPVVDTSGNSVQCNMSLIVKPGTP